MLHGIRWAWKQVLSPLSSHQKISSQWFVLKPASILCLSAGIFHWELGRLHTISFLYCATLLFCKPPHRQEIALRIDRANGCLSTLCCGAGNIWKWHGKDFVFVVSSFCPVSASLVIDTVYSQTQPKESSEEDHIQSGSSSRLRNPSLPKSFAQAFLRLIFVVVPNATSLGHPWQFQSLLLITHQSRLLFIRHFHNLARS